MRKIVFMIASVAIAISCSRPKEIIPPTNSMQKASNKVVIYQAFTRLFGNKNTTNKSYGTVEENGVGKFNDINDAALRSIKALGVSHIWFTGVIEHGVLTDYTQYGIPLDDADVVKGRAGSPYAIKDYYDVNPDLAQDVKNRMKEFEQLIERTHRNNLKVIIDFVPNHVARGYKSDVKPAGVKDLGETDDKTKAFSASNNFYYLVGESFKVPKGFKPLGSNTFPTLDGLFEETPAKVTGNDQFTASPGINEWFETVKLNYGVDYQQNRAKHFEPVPDTWNKMRDILLFWANKKVDGFRCDMAEMVPVEFWHWVIPQIKAVNDELVFIAEIYNPNEYRNYIETGKFDFLYDKVLLYDTLRGVINGDRKTSDIATVQQNLSDVNPHMLHFLENHDEQRAASKFFAGDPWRAFPAMVVSATVDKGPVMIYFGQEVGEPGLGNEGFQGEDGRTTIFDYWGVPEHQKWVNNGKYDGELLSPEQKLLRQSYGTLLTIASTNPAIVLGEYRDITKANVANGNFGNDVHAFVRFADEERLIVVTSYNVAEQAVKVQLPRDLVEELGMSSSGAYSAKDILANNVEVTFDNNLTFEVKLKPNSAFIFRIK
ncbi:alpha-amylase family protein [Pseudochryseolinea flava]|uniref:Alpha-amylase n=1 Tax=Pseudochryseolinea flava TaxID=2059302 RepID=A0A364Y1U3_9BACT|nr:alpha-amylase family protein [Pseudochryseolinea flava]RAW00253.1 alpha-amylase [Pseudochryseolinea flava]